MPEIGKVYRCGIEAVGEDWDYANRVNTNRLYYIHSGGGTYRMGDKEYEFIPGMLYFLPYTAEIHPKSSSKNPMLHTYADFELIPPIISDIPAICDPKSDNMLKAANEVFLAGAGNGNSAEELLFAAVKYLSVRAAQMCGFTFLKDRVIIESLEFMTENMAESISVSEMAKRHFMSADAFIRRFSGAMCVTPYAWLKNMRLKTAHSLIENGKTLAEAAADVGYSDASSLLHAMKNSREKIYPST